MGKFGNERITKKLLERILGIEISEITLDANKRLVGDLPDDKIGRIDVKAKLDNGEKVIIEMQATNYPSMEKRVLYYWAHTYIDDLKKGNPYKKLGKTIAILFTNYNIGLTESIKKYHTKWQIREEEHSKTKLTDDLEIHILELRKLNKEEVKTEEFGWMEFIKKGEVDMSSKYNKELLEAKEELEKLRADPATRDLYFDREMALMDFISGMEGSFEEGMKKGEEIGEKKGRKNEKIEMVKTMLKQGISVKMVAEISKLSSKEIEEISKNL